METTFNFTLLANAITATLANTPHTQLSSPELSLGCMATNALHLEILISDDEADHCNEILDNTTDAIRDAIINSIQEQGYRATPTTVNGQSNHLLIWVTDEDQTLYELIHLVGWDTEFAITATQYYL